MENVKKIRRGRVCNPKKSKAKVIKSVDSEPVSENGIWPCAMCKKGVDSTVIPSCVLCVKIR